jgi:hypothetical protein
MVNHNTRRVSKKGSRRTEINKGKRSVLFRNYKRNVRTAEHRGLPNSTVRSLASRVRNVTRNMKNKAKEAMRSRVKMSGKVVKLREINIQLSKALDIYIDELNEDNLSGDLIDAVSMLLERIYSETERVKDQLHGFKTEETNQYEYVVKLSDYIDDDIISGYKKASSANIDGRVKESEILIEILTKSIKASIHDIETALKASKSTMNEDEESDSDDENDSDEENKNAADELIDVFQALRMAVD